MTNLQRANEFVKQAEKKEKSWGFFGGSAKWEEAADLYVKAANLFKMDKKMREAGEAFKSAAKCDLQNGSKHDAASNLVNAANALRKDSAGESVECLKQAINLYTEEGRFSIAAKTAKDIGEILEQEENYDMALDAFQKAAEFYEGEAAPSNAQACLLKVAQISATLGDYSKAAALFEEIATKSLENNLLKFSAKEYFLRAGLCYLAMDDLITSQKAVERFEVADPGFTQSRECKLLKALLSAVEKKDAEEFSTVLLEYDNISKLDAWKTKLLLKIKKTIMPPEDEEEKKKLVSGGSAGAVGATSSSYEKPTEKEGFS